MRIEPSPELLTAGGAVMADASAAIGYLAGDTQAIYWLNTTYSASDGTRDRVLLDETRPLIAIGAAPF